MTVKELRFFRDHQAYASWWTDLNEDDKETITDTLADVPKEYESDQALQQLTSTVFQDLEADWLRVEGLATGVEVTYLTLDIEVAYDGDGMRDGSTVTANLHVTHPDSGSLFLTVSTYVRKPWSMFAPTTGDELDEFGPAAPVAEIIDTALALVNAEQADNDKFTFTARGNSDG